MTEQVSEGAPAPRRRTWLVWLAVLLGFPALLGLIYAFRQFTPVPTYRISSASMEPSLREGDTVAVQGARAFCGRVRPTPGDVVVYRKPGSRVLYMHRAVAGPGQTVEMRSGRLSIDGKPVQVRQDGRARSHPDLELGFEGDRIIETLPNGRSYATLDLTPDSELDNYGPAKIPAGHWLILGDSRDNAMDSRASGLTPASDICAVAISIIWSEDPARIGKRL